MCPILEAPHPGRQPKQGLHKRKNQYIPQVTEEHMSLYLSVNRGIYGHVPRAWGGGNIFLVYMNRGIYSTIFIDFIFYGGFIG
jgi:hypothetical protein